MQLHNLALLPIDTLFHGRYLVLRGLGAGAMGAVHEVRDVKTNSRCALKVMLPGVVENDDLRARFAQEARITGDIVSDHLVRVLDAGFDPPTGMPFLVMELLHGEELGRLLKQRRTLPAEEAILYLRQTALALDKTHAAGIVHRDLKPGNLFVAQRDDGSPCVKILDFGIAKVVAGTTQSQVTKPMGTPMYMAPEQILGKASVGPATDIYALGHIAYALLVGEPYWAEESRVLEIFPFMQRVIEGIEEIPSKRAARRNAVELPPAFDDWFRQATANAPSERFERATAAVAALGTALAPGKPKPSVEATVVARPMAAEPASTGPDSDMTRTLPMSATTSKAVAAAMVVNAPEPPAEPSTVLPGSISFSVTSHKLQGSSRRVFAIGGITLLTLAGAAGSWLLRADKPPPQAHPSTSAAAAVEEAAPPVPMQPQEAHDPPAEAVSSTAQPTAAPPAPAPTIVKQASAPSSPTPKTTAPPSGPAKEARPASMKAPSRGVPAAPAAAPSPTAPLSKKSDVPRSID
ncbi:serine/threonine-protein kinase [Polyangium spumosum]|nr:serine/threonine-protein kinase [Polyangium spumosum]